MSQTQQIKKTEEVQNETEPVAETEPKRHPEYEETTKSCYGSQADALSAFAEMQIKPSRITRRSELWKSFEQPAYYHYANSIHCYQWEQGAGLIERTSRQRRGDVRLRAQDGTQVVQVSASGILNLLSECDVELGLSHVVTQHTAKTDYDRLDTRENSVIEFEGGHYIVVLYDASANSREGSMYAGMFLANDDPRNEHVRRYIDRDAYAQLSDIVAPDEVLSSDLDVIDSSTYRNDEGWSVADNEGGYGDEEKLGNMIIRQGEWYFIPKPEIAFSSNEIEKPLSNYEDRSVLGSHVSRDQVVVDGERGQLRLDEETAPEIDDGVYVRGTVRHSRNEHSMFNLYETWHTVVENTEDMFVFESQTGGRWE